MSHDHFAPGVQTRCRICGELAADCKCLRGRLHAASIDHGLTGVFDVLVEEIKRMSERIAELESRHG